MAGERPNWTNRTMWTGDNLDISGLPTVEDHDWQAVRSWDRAEGLQLIERCAGCGAGRHTITAHDTREYRIISVYPDPLPRHCSGATGDGRGGLT